MDKKRTAQQISNFVCFRCGSIIKPSEKMVSICVSVETPTQDDSIECTDNTAISTVCFPCACVLINQAVMGDERLIMPAVTYPKTQEVPAENVRYIDSTTTEKIIVNLTSKALSPNDLLKVSCSDEGFCFSLNCADGISQANSQIFTWRQIAQLLITANPDMFGVLDEPLHQAFPEALERLGYYIPNWH